MSLIPVYNYFKTGWSIINNVLKWAAPRSFVPWFPSPEAAAKYIAERWIYTGDGPSGIYDFEIDPERLQYAMEKGPDKVRKLMLDCDDYAVWAYAALRQMRGCQPILVTITDSSGHWMHHVICLFSLNGICGAIDTNGFRLLPDLKSDTICRTWNNVYASEGVNYTEVSPQAYPFR